MVLLLLVALPLILFGLTATFLPLATAMANDHKERRRIVAAGGKPPLSIIERKDARRRAPVTAPAEGAATTPAGSVPAVSGPAGKPEVEADKVLVNA